MYHFDLWLWGEVDGDNFENSFQSSANSFKYAKENKYILSNNYFLSATKNVSYHKNRSNRSKIADNRERYTTFIGQR